MTTKEPEASDGEEPQQTTGPDATSGQSGATPNDDEAGCASVLAAPAGIVAVAAAAGCLIRRRRRS